MRKLSHRARLDRLAAVAVNVGLRPAKGQEVILTANVETLPLARLISKHAYLRGASLVTTILADDALSLARFHHSNDEYFDHTTPWLFDGIAKAITDGAARMAIVGDNPNLLSGLDGNKVMRTVQARSQAARKTQELLMGFHCNWSGVSYAGKAWARMVFPNLPPRQAVKELWEAIFKASRVDGEDPVTNWMTHNANLAARRDWLTDQNFHALHFKGPGTDLIVGLAQGHQWCGGAETAKNGITCNPNIPTEEVFTTPNSRLTMGVVTSTKPLSYQGQVIEGIQARFADGKIVSASAVKGDEALQRMLNMDDGARHLGEVALVPHSSPISQSGLLFFNTLFDENAASHIAQGRAYPFCMQDYRTATVEDLAARGANDSKIHVDWMIGSQHMDVDGVHTDGTSVPVMRKGEWAQTIV